MNAIMSGIGAENQESSTPSLSYPKAQWNDIAEKTRTEYLSDFRQAMAQIKSKK